MAAKVHADEADLSASIYAGKRKPASLHKEAVVFTHLFVLTNRIYLLYCMQSV